MATSKKSTRNKLAPLVREIAAAKGFLLYRDEAKVQPLVAQVGWSHNQIDASVWTAIPVGGAP